MGLGWLRAKRVGLAALAVGVLALLAYGLFLLASKPEREGYARFARGPLRTLTVSAAPAPQTTHEFIDAAGRARTLAAFRGEVVLLNVWATWCGPCRMEMPTLAALQRRFGARGLRVVAVSIDRPAERDAAQALLAELGGGALDFYIDPLSSLAFAVRAPGLPTTILFGRDGRELARLAGGADWASPEAAALVEAALGEAPDR